MRRNQNFRRRTKKPLSNEREQFMKASNDLRSFAKWQDLIDERNIFLLYLKFGKDFGASEEDIALAKKNMGFICANDKIKPLLPESDCR